MNSLIRLWLIACAFATSAIWASTYYLHLNSDSIIPSMVSVYRWEPFFWGQDRYGMLIPLLLSSIKDPLTNFLVHCWVSIFIGIVSFGIVSRFFLGPGESWIAVGFLAPTLFLFTAPAAYLGDFLAPSIFYPPSLVLGSLALLVLERARVPGSRWSFTLFLGLSLILMTLGHWVNHSIGVLLILLVLGKAFLLKPHANRRAQIEEALSGLGLSIFGMFAGLVLVNLSRHHGSGPVPSFSAPEHWISGWVALWTNPDRGWAGPWRWSLLIPPSVILLLSPWGSLKNGKFHLRSLLALLIPALVYSLMAGASEHARENAYAQRYLQPGLLLALSGISTFFIQSVGPGLQRCLPSRWIRALAFLTLLWSAVAAFGLPGPQIMNEAIQRQFGGALREVQAAHCTHLIGDYWQVWPAVLLTNSERYRSGDPRGISPRTLRAPESWEESLRGRNSLRLCVLEEDPRQAEARLAREGLSVSFRRISSSPCCSVFEPVN